MGLMGYTKTRHAVIGSRWSATVYLNGSVTSVVYHFTNNIDSSLSISGFINPSWKQQISQGLDATTPASWSGVEGDFPLISGSAGSTDRFNRRWSLDITHSGTACPTVGWSPASNVDGSTSTAVHNRALQKFFDAVNEARTAFESGQDIGELKETMESAIHPMNSLKNLTLGYISKAKSLRRQFLSKHIKMPTFRKALADTWLEYRFGWRPLAMDVADACSKLRQRQMSNVTRVRAYAEQRYSGLSGSCTLDSAIGNGGIYISYQNVGIYSECYIAGVKNGCDNGGLRPLNQELQLDLPHFVPTLWDLVPYSWLVDYFTNVGEFLQGLTFQSSDIVWGNHTTRQQRITNWGYPVYATSGVDGSFNIYSGLAGGGNSLNIKTGSRNVITGASLIPTFAFSIPLSSRPWENIAALLTSRLA